MDPHFRYCCPVWDVAGASEINHLQKLQTHAARIITSSRYDAPSKMLIKQLGWRTIKEMIQYESRVMVYKSVDGLAPQYFQDIFTRNSANPSYELVALLLIFISQNEIRPMVKKGSRSREQNCGTASQLR